MNSTGKNIFNLYKNYNETDKKYTDKIISSNEKIILKQNTENKFYKEIIFVNVHVVIKEEGRDDRTYHIHLKSHKDGNYAWETIKTGAVHNDIKKLFDTHKSLAKVGSKAYDFSKIVGDQMNELSTITITLPKAVDKFADPDPDIQKAVTENKNINL